jgi:hypothetical protein
MSDPISLCGQVDGALLMRHVTTFGQWIKLSGTAAELDSLHYVQAQLDGYGFRTKILQHDAYISLPGTSLVTADNAVLPSITYSFSQPSPPDGLAAELIYVGAGSEADFAARNVRGAIVLVDGIATPPVTLRACRAGAVGQLHISPHEHLHEMCISPIWGNPSAETRRDLPTTVVCSVLPSDGNPLRDRLARGDRPKVVLQAEVDTGWRKTPILVADFDPPIASDGGPFVLFSGHHDTWHYGVMDNGTANAAMLEVARLCAAKRQSWQRGLRLCFWSGHSHGRYSGSAWYVDQHFDELDQRCVAHINADSLGAQGADLLQNVGSMSELYAVAAEAIQTHSGQHLSGKRMSRGADQSFNGLGLPALFGDLSEPEPTPIGAHCWWWHTPDDLADKIDRGNLVRDTSIYVHATWRLLTDTILPLDYAATASALQHELELLAPSGDLMDAARTLQANAGTLKTRATARDAMIVNRALMQVSRALVPLDYTTGDRFAHDPALAQPAWAALQPLRTLASAASGTDEARFLSVGAIRTRNRILSGLRQANAALEAVIERLG